MGNSLTAYRQAIGLHNNIKMCFSCTNIGIRTLSILSVVCIIFVILLLRCGDIEINPGPFKLKSLSLCHVNIRGLSDFKLRAMKTSLCEKYDIITMSETFLGPHSTADLTLPGYHAILRRDRPTFGGGVAIYIRENIIFKQLHEFSSESLENMWIQVNTQKENY